MREFAVDRGGASRRDVGRGWVAVFEWGCGGVGWGSWGMYLRIYPHCIFGSHNASNTVDTATKTSKMAIEKNSRIS